MPDSNRIDLRQIAHRAMEDAGFKPDFPPGVLRELSEAPRNSPTPSTPDFRPLLWSSIDNVESRDLDQIEVVEPSQSENIRLLIGIADVDSLVPKGSAADLHAAQNATSVYTGVETFPLFPPEISNDLTSLLEDQDRLAVIIDITVDANGGVSAAKVSRGAVRNHAKLDYESAGAWLEETGPAPERVSSLAGLPDQLHLQAKATERLKAQRIRAGALEFESIEPKTITRDGDVVGLALERKNPARELIENLMIAANSAMATFLEARGWPSIQRVVRTPERWPRIRAVAAEHGEQLPDTPDSKALAEFLSKQRRANPDGFAYLSLAIVKLIGAGEYVVVRNAGEQFGHFGLAVQDYTHGTAPNRRYPDVIIQRLLKAAIAGNPCPYSAEELEVIATHCNERASAARKIERLMRKVAAASFLSRRIGETFDAIVTGASPKGTYVRIKNPPAEGRVVRGAAGMDIGQTVRVRLIATVPEKGFIDFARAN